MKARRRKSARTTFDRAYYRRFYEDPDTRSVGPADTGRLVAHVAAYLKYLDIPVRTALDVGCGLGLWRALLAEHFPGLRYTGIETSEYACERFGWRRASVATFESASRYDLVICQSVLQYVSAGEVRAGIRNLARLCGGAMYLELVTREDWERNCDRSGTDGEIHLRAARWYRRLLAPHFTNCGGGVFLPVTSDTVLYEMEKA
jgi:SAM-dependent methyltransferase